MTATILTVEDERDVLELIRFHLAKAGYRILTATSGREALEVIRLQRPDLVLLDLMLPDIDGFGVCEILRRNPETAALPIVIVSAWNTSDSRNLGLELGALDYLSKPFSPRALVERVQHLLSQRLIGKRQEEIRDVQLELPAISATSGASGGMASLAPPSSVAGYARTKSA